MDGAPIQQVVTSRRQLAQPLVSVVLAARNHGRWLPEAVRAILDQDIGDEIELIVCDDASTDDTPALMRTAVVNAKRPVTYVRLTRRLNQAGARNVALGFAKGRFIAFTDSDCVPATDWLKAALRAFQSPDVGMVQGRTGPVNPRSPFFSHFIVTEGLDGSFSTSNIVYRREAIRDQWFDRTLWYWEDVDLGWRILRSGWRVVFAEDAFVGHQIVPLTPVQWLLWPRRYWNWPAKAACYPSFRQHLFMGVWVRPVHLLFDLAVAGLVISRWRRAGLLLALPYAYSFGRARGVRGRFPPAKVAAYVGWDSVALISLVVGSIKHRSVVL